MVCVFLKDTGSLSSPAGDRCTFDFDTSTSWEQDPDAGMSRHNDVADTRDEAGDVERNPVMRDPATDAAPKPQAPEQHDAPDRVASRSFHSRPGEGLKDVSSAREGLVASVAQNPEYRGAGDSRARNRRFPWITCTGRRDRGALWVGFNHKGERRRMQTGFKHKETALSLCEAWRQLLLDIEAGKVNELHAIDWAHDELLTANSGSKVARKHSRSPRRSFSSAGVRKREGRAGRRVAWQATVGGRTWTFAESRRGGPDARLMAHKASKMLCHQELRDEVTSI